MEIHVPGARFSTVFGQKAIRIFDQRNQRERRRGMVVMEGGREEWWGRGRIISEGDRKMMGRGE